MRLKSVFIGHYKNLRDLTVKFDGGSFIDVFVGKNGSGKSNFFEALIEIFRHITEFGKDEADMNLDYAICYEIEGKDTFIEWKDRQLSIDGKPRKSLGQSPLPDNVLIYYSGHNPTVAALVKRYEDAFRTRIKGADIGDSRRFISIGPDYKSLLLTVLLLQPEANKARTFVCQKLGVEKLGIQKPGTTEFTEPVVRVVFERPGYAKANKGYDIESNNESDRYWKPEGITRTFLNRLTKCITRAPGDITVTEGYFAAEDRYVLYLNIERLRQEFADYRTHELFQQFDNLKTLGMLSEIAVPLRLRNGIEANITHFSDGQFQSVYIYTIVELFKERNCVTLLDEPDAFLHPEWQFEFLKQVHEITDAGTNANQILMSTHSAATLCNWEQQSVSYLTINLKSITHSRKSKREAIHELSDSFIQYSEDESKLLIDNVVRSSRRPILFVEGPCDVSILNTAYKKLYPGEDNSILIQDAFDRGFLRTLLARNELFAKYPDKCFFAIFDFDDAYEDWRELGGEHVVTQIERGLCRKLTNKNAHTFLLPIPDSPLRSQVWDDANPIERIIPKPHFCVEHVFWGIKGLEEWFRTDPSTGKIVFRGDKFKVRFAKEVVPSLEPAAFESFRPIFEFIKLKCAEAIKPKPVAA